MTKKELIEALEPYDDDTKIKVFQIPTWKEEDEEVYYDKDDNDITIYTFSE